jgi:uncharacterized protein YjbI with pentapeptide repeats
MANIEHLRILEEGWETWNEWRKDNHFIEPDLSGADLNGAELGDRAEMMVRILNNRHTFQGVDFSYCDMKGVKLNANLLGADLGRADLTDADLQNANLNYSNLAGAKLFGANLSAAQLRQANLAEVDLSNSVLNEADMLGANLSNAVLKGAKLRGANLTRTKLVETNLDGADISGCSVYGISAWDVSVKDTNQSNLTVTPEGVAAVTVDNLEVAQFVYLLLNNQKIRDVINTLGQKAVLILGRFSPERKEVLDALAEALRLRGFLPIIFDFEKSQERDFTETIMTLAGLSLFVIADITNPKSSPLELHATVPNYMIPFVPIIQEGERPFSMFSDLRNRYDWVLDTLVYPSTQVLLAGLDAAIINRAMVTRDKLLARKSEQLKTIRVEDFLNT